MLKKMLILGTLSAVICTQITAKEAIDFNGDKDSGGVYVDTSKNFTHSVNLYNKVGKTVIKYNTVKKPKYVYYNVFKNRVRWVDKIEWRCKYRVVVKGRKYTKIYTGYNDKSYSSYLKASTGITKYKIRIKTKHIPLEGLGNTKKCYVLINGRKIKKLVHWRNGTFDVRYSGSISAGSTIGVSCEQIGWGSRGYILLETS
jgi:hypothetical protein